MIFGGDAALMEIVGLSLRVSGIALVISDADRDPAGGVRWGCVVSAGAG